jgi:hypothetical protein
VPHSLGCKLNTAGCSQPSIPGVYLTQQLLRTVRVAARQCVFDLSQPGSELLVDSRSTTFEFTRIYVVLAK